MKTVIDFRVEEKFSPALSAFLEQLSVTLAETMPEQPFIFLTDAPVSEAYPSNVAIKAVPGSSFGWLDRKRLLTLLEEEQAGRYIRFGPLAIHISRPRGKGFLVRDLRQPLQHIVFSEYDRSRLQPAPGSAVHCIKPAWPGLPGPLSWPEAESIRTQYSAGKEYFLFTGDIDAPHRLIELLKAFSLFKKRQQSNMQLVIAGYSTAWTDGFEEKLLTYKYRADVIVLKDPEYAEIIRLAAAAYAMVYPANGPMLPLSLLMGVQGGTAVIASDIPINHEWTDAAEWIDNSRLEEGFAQAMMLLYKDESRKQQLLQKAKQETTSAGGGEMIEAIGRIIREGNDK